jgi:membrane dipeptidase
VTVSSIVPLAADLGRLPAAAPELSADLDARLRHLLSGTTISLHDHPFRLPDPLNARTWELLVDSGQHHIGDDGLGESALNAVFASALAGGELAEVLRWADTVRRNLDEARHSRFGLQWTDVGRAGAVTVFLALEDLACIGTDLAGLDALHAAGIRSAGLTYNAGNPLGGGLGQPTDPGLSALGRDAMRHMEELGVLVDLAHVGDTTSLDAAAVAGKPLVISHAGARAVWPTPRMKPDEVIKAVADTGGLIGIEAAPGSTRSRKDNGGHDLDDVMRHVEYCAELVGIAHVALGPDTFFGDHLGLYDAAGWPRPVAAGLPELDIDHVAGMENPAEAAPHAAAWLLARGWSDDDIAAVIGNNAARVLGEVL